MGLFDMLRTKVKTETVCACVSGRVVPMASIPDPVFAEGILGTAIGIEPEGEEICAPCDAVVTQVADSLHAIGLKTKEGAELLIHVGIDTVQMVGDGFSVKVNEEAHVRAGEVLLTFDRAKIREAGYKETVITAVTNADRFQSVVPAADPVKSAVQCGEALLIITK